MYTSEGKAFPEESCRDDGRGPRVAASISPDAICALESRYL